jgi:hypothetical protein
LPGGDDLRSALTVGTKLALISVSLKQPFLPKILVQIS